MKRKRLTSLILSTLLAVSMACSPVAGMSVLAAKEASESSETTEEEITEEDVGETEEIVVEETSEADGPDGETTEEKAAQNEPETLQNEEDNSADESTQEMIEEETPDIISDDASEDDADEETENIRIPAMADDNDINAENDYVAQAILTDDHTFTFYYGPLVSVGDTLNGNSVKYVFYGEEVSDTGNNRPSWYGITIKDGSSYYSFKNYVSSVIFDSSFEMVKPTSTYGWFEGFSNVEEIDLSALNTSDVTTMCRMFSECSSLNALDLTYLNTSNVTDMSYMFNDCEDLTNLSLSSLDTSSVTDMSYIFCDCENLTVIDVSGFDTSKVTNMAYMFKDCSRITSLDVSGFDTANVTDMEEMFGSCNSLTSLDVSDFDTSNVTNMSGMFNYCYNLTSLDVSDFDTSNVTDMRLMFVNCQNLTSLDVSNFNTSNVTDMGYMFDNCQNLTSLDVSNFDTSNVTDMSYMFDECLYLTSLDVSNFDTSNVTDMSNMFYKCQKLTGLDVSGFETSKVIGMAQMFSSCSKLTSLDVSGFDTSNVPNMSYMFYCCRGLTSLDVSNFDTSKATNMYRMFNGCSGLTSLDVSKFDTSNVTDMSDMFGGCENLTNLDTSRFDTSKATDMHSMFSSCECLTNLDVSNFDTAKVTNMEAMFRGCSNLTNLSVSGFDTSKVTKMAAMFRGCSSITSLDVSGFDTANVTDMDEMFDSCNSLTSLDVSSFDTSKVCSMTSMFRNCSSLTNIDVSNFVTTRVGGMAQMFAGSSSLKSLDLSNFDAQTKYRISMFDGCTSLEMIYCLDNMTDWSGSSGSYMFRGCTSLAGTSGDLTVNYDSTKIDSSMAKSADLGGYFTPKGSGDDPGIPDPNSVAQAIWTENNATLTFYYGLPVAVGDDFNGETVSEVWSGTNVTATEDQVPQWTDTIKTSVTTVIFDSSFKNVRPTSTYKWFSYCSNLTSIDLSGLNTSEVTNMYEMFFACGSLESIDVSKFNTSKATSMAYMFSGCSELTELDIRKFDTSKVTELTGMFNGCSSLQNLDVSNFNTASATSMSYMFYQCSSLTSLDVEGFDTSSATGTAYTYMFGGCSRLTSLDVSSFDLDHVTKLDFMFSDCNELVTIYCTDSVTDWSYKSGDRMFSGCNSLVGLYGNTKVNYDSSKIDSSMAKAATPGLGGYFTPKDMTKCGKNVFWEINQDGTLVISGTGPMYDYGGFETRGPETPWFKHINEITNLEVRNGVTYIGQCSFESLPKLNKVDIPSSVSVIGKRAFMGCTMLNEIVFKNGITKLKESSFEATHLRKIFLPASLEQIEQKAFKKTELFNVFYENNKDAWLNLDINLTDNDPLDYMKSKVHFNAKDINDYPQKDWWSIDNHATTSYHHIDSRIWESVLGKNVGKKFGDENTKAGLCFGLAESAILFDLNFLKYSDFEQATPPNCVYDLTTNAYHKDFNMTAEEMIKLAFTLQYIPDFHKALHKTNINKYDKLYEALNHYVKTGQDQVCLALKNGNSGHALWAYALEEEDEFCDIYIYNCNSPEIPQIVRLFGSYPSFTGFRIISNTTYKDISFAVNNEDMELAVATYHQLTPTNPLVKLREQGYTVVLGTKGITYLKDSSGNFIPVTDLNGTDTEDADEEMFYCETDNEISVCNNEETNQKISFIDNVSSFEILLPPNASADFKENCLSADYSEGDSLISSYTTVAGEDTVTIDLSGNATDNMQFDFSGNELIVNGIPELNITVDHNDTVTSAEAAVNEGGAIHIKTEETNGVQLIVSLDEDNNGTFESEHSYTILPATQNITVKAKASSVAVGKTTTITTAGAEGSVSYKSSNEGVATVSSTGVVTAKKVGTTTITVTASATEQYDQATKTVTIKVVPAATTSITTANQTTGIKLTWKKVAGATGYLVYRNGTKIATTNKGTAVTITDKKANTNGAKYTYKVVAKGSTGTSTLSKSVTTYRLSRPTITSLMNSASKKMTVKWRKNAKSNGYQVQYSLKSNFVSGSKTITLKKNSIVSTVIGSLTKGKKYYVRIRCFRIAGGKKYYSAWSTLKATTIKK